MHSSNNTYRVAIIGGGPVGLFLGCCLKKTGINCVVLEQREAPVTQSRSIGIHPVSLELLDRFTLSEEFIKNGVEIKRGQVFWDSKKWGTLSFASCPPPYRFILSLPQYKTEKLLSSYLNRIDPSILQRNAKVIGLQENSESVQLQIIQKGKRKIVNTDYVAGCDGMNSFVRKEAGIAFKGTNYKDFYIMGDFSDNTHFGSDAAIFLGRQGLIESFPLPGNRRRWVVKTDKYLPDIDRDDIEKCVNERVHLQLNQTENFMLSSFKVFEKRAETMQNSRIILAGDAAHVVSPIGGQGMNLGWMGAADLAQCFQQIFANKADSDEILQGYSTRRLAIARKASRRAAFNMALGRKMQIPFLKKIILRTILKTPLSKLMANLFTMHGLEKWPV